VKAVLKAFVFVFLKIGWRKLGGARLGREFAVAAELNNFEVGQIGVRHE